MTQNRCASQKTILNHQNVLKGHEKIDETVKTVFILVRAVQQTYHDGICFFCESLKFFFKNWKCYNNHFHFLLQYS